MFDKKYAEFTIKVTYSIDFMLKRLKNRSLSWRSWCNYFFVFDNRVDFIFSKCYVSFEGR